MNATELKRKMMALWKETFHDSDEYINLIFDKYFDPELVEYEAQGAEIVASMLGIPYEFGGERGKIQGLYLCGLATKQRYRGQGIMGNLIEKMNEKAREKGYAFTFLIPSSERSHRYYLHHGYVDAFYRCEQNYTSLHDFAAEYDTILEAQKGKVAELKRRYFSSLEGGEVKKDAPIEMLENIRKMVLDYEKEQSDMEVFHNESHIETVIEESKISGGKIYYVATQQGQITAVAFTKLVDRSRVEVERLISTDLCSTYRLLDHIKKSEPDAGIQIYIDPKVAERKNLAKAHGMARILNLSEILKFQANGHGDLKYSILVNEHSGLVERYNVRGGEVKHESLDMESEDYDSSKTVMSLRDISSVLFRRPDTGSLIVEAFGMPSLGGYITLMLD